MKKKKAEERVRKKNSIRFQWFEFEKDDKEMFENFETFAAFFIFFPSLSDLNFKVLFFLGLFWF